MRVLILIACLLCLPALAAEPLRIATFPNYPPMTYRDPATSQRMGFDIDMGEAIAKTLGTTVDWQEMAFVQFIPALTTGRIVMALDGIGDIPSRRDMVDFVDYFRTGAIFFTLSASPAKTVADLCGLKVGASRSTTWPADIKAWSDRNCGAKPLEIIGTEGSIDTRIQLRTGRLDVGVQGSETIGWLQQTDPGLFRPIGTAFTEVIGGIPMNKTDPALRDAVRAAVQKLMDDGTYKALLAKWHLEDNAIPKATINGQ